MEKAAHPLRPPFRADGAGAPLSFYSPSPAGFHFPPLEIRLSDLLGCCRAWTVRHTLLQRYAGIARARFSGRAFHPPSKAGRRRSFPCLPLVVRSSLTGWRATAVDRRTSLEKGVPSMRLRVLGTLVALCAGLLSSGCIREHRCCHRLVHRPACGCSCGCESGGYAAYEGSVAPPLAPLTGPMPAPLMPGGSH
jgi:hypothetical protein